MESSSNGSSATASTGQAVSTAIVKAAAQGMLQAYTLTDTQGKMHAATPAAVAAWATSYVLANRVSESSSPGKVRRQICGVVLHWAAVVVAERACCVRPAGLLACVGAFNLPQPAIFLSLQAYTEDYACFGFWAGVPCCVLRALTACCACVL